MRRRALRRRALRRRTMLRNDRSYGTGVRSKGKSGVLLGHLTALVLKDGRSIKSTALKGAFLGWMPSTNNFCVVRKASGRPASLSSKDREIFRRFHQSAVKKASTYEWPEARGLRPIGRLKSLTYVVPEWVKSEQKRGYRWVHEFGDHGERGHGKHDGFKGYPEHLMPLLCKAADGSLHIKRMPGNRYNVTEWIYW